MAGAGGFFVVLLLSLFLACAGDSKGSDKGELPGGQDTADADEGDDTAEPCEEQLFYEDGDADGYGAVEVLACEAPEGFVAQGGDCDDANPDVHPAAEETCNGIDDDCDGELDPEALMVSSYADTDGDGYGDPSNLVFACPGAEGGVSDACDCDDTNASAPADLLVCPALECPAEGGLWLRGECGAATQVDYDGGLELTEDSALTLCEGTHALSLTVNTDRVRVQGMGRDTTLWGAKPALVVVREGAEVRISGVSLFGGTYSGSGGKGVLIDATAGSVDLHMDDVILGKTTAGVANVSVIEVDGDLSLTDSQLMRILMQYGSAYSNSCSQVGVNVTGDLSLLRTDVSELTGGCSSWSHSALNEASASGIIVGGDARLEEVSITGVDLRSYSSGVAAYGTLYGLHVAGDLAATDLSITDNTVTTEVDCSDYSCDRSLSGALVVLGGEVSWAGGTLDANVFGLDGTMYSSAGTFDDALSGGHLAWYPGAGDTLSLVDVDLGSDASPDLTGTVEYDGEGLTTVTCDESGCW